MKKYLILLMILFLSQMAFPKSVNIVFRLDDYRLVHDSINEKIVHLFMKYRIPLVLGVIPCDDNENLKFDSTNYLWLSFKQFEIASINASTDAVMTS